MLYALTSHYENTARTWLAPVNNSPCNIQHGRKERNSTAWSTNLSSSSSSLTTLFQAARPIHKTQNRQKLHKTQEKPLKTRNTEAQTCDMSMEPDDETAQHIIMLTVRGLYMWMFALLLACCYYYYEYVCVTPCSNTLAITLGSFDALQSAIC